VAGSQARRPGADDGDAESGVIGSVRQDGAPGAGGFKGGRVCHS
jgi:hypothetical protein